MGDVEVPSKVPVEGWARGIDGNWWPPAPVRQRPTPTPQAAPARPRHQRRMAGVLIVVIVAAAIAVLVTAIVFTIRAFEDRPTSRVGARSGYVLMR